MTRVILIVCFLIAFAAGLAVGIQSRRPGPPPGDRPGRHSGWLAGELNLTPQQQEQLKVIWSETAMRGGREREDRHRECSRDRDAQIAELVRPEDRPKYDEIMRKHAERKAALDREWRSAFDAAVEKTKQILTPEQRVKYETMLKHHEAERGQRDRFRGEREDRGPRRGEHRAASRPTPWP